MTKQEHIDRELAELRTLDEAHALLTEEYRRRLEDLEDVKRRLADSKARRARAQARLTTATELPPIDWREYVFSEEDKEVHRLALQVRLEALSGGGRNAAVYRSVLRDLQALKEHPVTPGTPRKARVTPYLPKVEDLQVAKAMLDTLPARERRISLYRICATEGR